MIRKFLQALRGRPKTVGATAAAAATAVVFAVATPMIQDHEGLRTKSYLDPVGIPTICFGETLGVNMGDRVSVSECHEMLKPRLQGFLKEMRACTNVPLPAKTEAALLSFTYNVGAGTYCRNIAQKRINQGRITEACEALKLYVKAGRPLRTLPGLVRRRSEESALCLQGLKERG